MSATIKLDHSERHFELWESHVCKRVTFCHISVLNVAYVNCKTSENQATFHNVSNEGNRDVNIIRVSMR